MRKKILFIFLCLMFLSGTGYTAGTTAANYLKFSASARASAMGDICIGIDDDASGIYWYSAGLANIRNMQLAMAYISHVHGIYNGFTSIVIPVKNNIGVFGIGMQTFGTDNIDSLDAGGNSTGLKYNAVTNVTGISYSKQIGNRFSAGIYCKNISENIENESSAGFAADISGKYAVVKDKMDFGFVIQNIGAKMGYIDKFELPLSVRMGIGWKADKQSLLGVDVNIPNDNVPSLCFGYEYKFLFNKSKNSFSLRSGINTSYLKLGGLSGLSFGFGFNIHKLSVDFGLVPFGNIGNISRMSLNFGF